MSMFNPFGKSFEDITESDLEILKNLSEGWYVEYKKEKSSKEPAKKIAKSITSFANSYGGLFFLGVESDKSTNEAIRFPGVCDFPDLIKDAVRSNAQPFPFFETHCIKLSNGKQVLMSVVRTGENPPYIHADGRIYRRQESSSDPIFEDNRHAIDDLHRKAEEYQKKLDEFRQIDYGFCKGEEIPRLEIFLNTSPFNQFEVKGLHTTRNDYEALLPYFSSLYTVKDETNGTNLSTSGNIPFDTFSTYHNSVVIRQMKGKDLAYNGLSLEIDIHGNTKIFLPLTQNALAIRHISGLNPEYLEVLNNYHQDSIHSLTCLDGKDLLGASVGLFAKIFSFLIEKGYQGDLEVMLRLTNCWRTTMYFDSQTFRDHIKRHGLPVCMKHEQSFPENPIYFSNQDLKAPCLFRLFGVFAWIAMALGTPADVAGVAITEELAKST